MAKNSITDYSKTAASNTDIQSVDIDEGCLPSGINNAIRELMADLADVNDGTVALTSPSFAAASLTGNLSFGDNNKAIFGASSDLQIYHDGTHSYVRDEGTGGLILTTNGAAVYIQKGDTETSAEFDIDGAVKLRYDNAQKFATTSTGIDVNGTVTANGLTVDTNTLYVDSTNDRVGINDATPSEELDINGDGSDVRIRMYDGAGASVGRIEHSGANFDISNTATSTATMTFTTGSGSGSERMRIDSSGRVGIGTSSPSQVLEITNGTSPAYVVQTRGDLQTILGPTGSLVTSAGQVGTITNSPFRFTTNNTERMRIDSSGQVGIGTSSPASTLHVKAHINSINGGLALESNDGSQKATIDMNDSGVLRFYQNGNARMRLNSDGDFMFAKTTSSYTNTGIEFDYATGRSFFTVAGQYTSIFNRKTNDGIVIYIAQDSTLEGSISVSGTTVSYNGGHLARWSQLTDGTKDETIVKGTVMTNLDQMAVWSHDAVEAQDAVYDEDGNVVTEAVEAKDAYTEDNEQLNCMAVSSVEGDPNVAGVFVNWDNDDDEFNDMNIAMTGDMVIRIAQGTTVARGDLLMSAGDGTAKPQGDDIVRSKTIAKVTSTNVSHTYDDGSYLVPCVLMAC